MSISCWGLVLAGIENFVLINAALCIATFTGVLIAHASTLTRSWHPLSITLAAYQEGATDLLPLIEAQRTRSEVRQQYFHSLFDYQISLLLLESAIGEEIQP